MPSISEPASADSHQARGGIGVVLGVLLVVATATLGLWHATAAAITQTHLGTTESRKLTNAP
jgi:hypothetical protein